MLGIDSDCSTQEAIDAVWEEPLTEAQLTGDIDSYYCHRWLHGAMQAMDAVSDQGTARRLLHRLGVQAQLHVRQTQERLEREWWDQATEQEAELVRCMTADADEQWCFA